MIKKLINRIISNRAAVFVFFVLLSVFLFRKILVSPGTVGHLLDWWIPSEVDELQMYFNQAFSTWRSHALGYSEAFMVISFFQAFFGIFGIWGANGEWVSKIYLLSFIFMAGFSMYLLLEKLLESSNKEGISLPALVGGLFYSLSPVMINQILGGAGLFILAYWLAPLIFFFFLKAVNDKRIFWPYAAIAGILFAIAGIDNHFFGFIPILFFLYALFQKEKIVFIKVLAFIILLTLLLHSYWLINFLANYRFHAASFITTGDNKAYLQNLADHSGPLTSVFTLMANFNPFLFLSVMFSWLELPWFLISFILLIIIYGTAFFSPRKNLSLYALTVVLIGIFFAKGIVPPFKNINLWLYENFVPMNLFRTLHHIQTLIAFGYAVLVGIFIDYIKSKLSKKKFFLSVFGFLILLTIYIHPLLTGDINGGIWTFQEPASLTLIKKDMDKGDREFGKTDYRIAFVPMMGSVGFKDKRTDLAPGGSFTTVLNSSRPTLDVLYRGASGELTQYLERSLYFDGTSTNLSKIMALTNVKYIIPRDDLIYIHLNYGKGFWKSGEAYESLLKRLSRQEGLIKKDSFPDMELWENTYFLPHFYVPKNIIQVPNNEDSVSKINISGEVLGETRLNQLSSIVSGAGYDIRSGIFFDNNRPAFDGYMNNKVMPKITFTRINPTKYKIKVEGAKDPYLLIFSESFNKEWKLYLNENASVKHNIVASYFDGEVQEGKHKNSFIGNDIFETWGKKSIAGNNHFQVNGYANSWMITPQDAGHHENYEIIVEFWFQRYFYIGLVISGVVITISLWYLLFYFLQKARN